MKAGRACVDCLPSKAQTCSNMPTQRSPVVNMLIVHWRKNSFNIPHGKAGKTFTDELAHLFLAFASGSALESVALKAATVLHILTLLKPSRKSKPKDHNSCLERRMKLWEYGNINELVR